MFVQRTLVRDAGGRLEHIFQHGPVRLVCDHPIGLRTVSSVSRTHSHYRVSTVPVRVILQQIKRGHNAFVERGAWRGGTDMVGYRHDRFIMTVIDGTP